jgi:hypothetical protein
MFSKNASRFWITLASGGLFDGAGINAWVDSADWTAVAER